jgi:hypothetical protein
MKFYRWLISWRGLTLLSLLVLLVFAKDCHAQNSRFDGVVFTRNGNPAPGAQVAVCSQVAITAASETLSTATITTTLNPPQGSTVLITGVTPTQYNGSFTVLTTSGTNFTYSNPVQGLGAGTIFGTTLITGPSVCSPLAALCASSPDAVCTSPNPVTADGLGNYSFYIVPGRYTQQFFGSGLTARIQPDQILACDPSNCTLSGNATFGNVTVGGTLGVKGAATTKILQGIPHCKDFATPGVTSFDAMMTACIAALPATGSGTVNAMDVADTTNLTMTATWTMSRSNTTILFGCYTVTQSTFSMNVPSPTNNIAFIGCGPIGADPSSTQRGTYFIYTGTGSAHTLGDTLGTSYNHEWKNISVDLVNAGSAAIGVDSSRVYHTILQSVRVVGKTGVSTQILIRNNGTASAPGSQNFMLINPYLSNGFIGYQCIGGNSPPTCNMNQWIGGEYSGPGSGIAGSIGADIENGNNNGFFGPTISNVETAVKVASTSGLAAYGNYHAESVVNCASFSATANNNRLESDCNAAVIDSGGFAQQNTLHDSSILTGYDSFYGALKVLGTTNPSLFNAGINIKSGTNTGFPAGTSGGNGGFIAAGFNSPSAIRIYCGDGTGFQCEFAKRTGSADTVLGFISDAGNMSMTKYTSTVATGTAPLVITSTTPVANLTTVPTTYNAAGTQQTAAHLVVDTCTLGTSCGITLSGSAAFTSATTYSCSCHDQTTPTNACNINQTGGGAITITGTGTDVIRYHCAGN